MAELQLNIPVSRTSTASFTFSLKSQIPKLLGQKLCNAGYYVAVVHAGKVSAASKAGRRSEVGSRGRPWRRSSCRRC